MLEAFPSTKPTMAVRTTYDECVDLMKAYEDALDLSSTDTKTVVVLNFKSLQLLRIKTLQKRLFDLQMRFQLGGIEPENYDQSVETLDSTLHAYGRALRNYEFLAQDSLEHVPPGSSLFGRPSKLIEKQARSASRGFLDKIRRNHKTPCREFELTDWEEYTLGGENVISGGNYILNKSLEFRELDQHGRETRARRIAFSERLTMALFGGIALIGPMLIMVLYHSQTTSLVTTSIATVLFAIFLALQATDASGKDVLAATAAYTAVLVVFVGTNSART